jgi:excinuclease ABC subunit A
MPWTKLGKKWHFLNKGFSSGQPMRWSFRMLEDLTQLLEKLAPQGTWHWGHKQIVHYSVPSQREPWVSIQTKKSDGLWVHLSGPKNAATLGQVTEFSQEAAIAALGSDREVIHLKVFTSSQLRSPAFRSMLAGHLAAVSRTVATPSAGTSRRKSSATQSPGKQGR